MSKPDIADRIADILVEDHVALMNEVRELRAQRDSALAALVKVMHWWMTTPAFAEGEDEMPAEIFDAAMEAINKVKGESK